MLLGFGPGLDLHVAFGDVEGGDGQVRETARKGTADDAFQVVVDCCRFSDELEFLVRCEKTSSARCVGAG